MEPEAVESAWTQHRNGGWEHIGDTTHDECIDCGASFLDLAIEEGATIACPGSYTETCRTVWVYRFGDEDVCPSCAAERMAEEAEAAKAVLLEAVLAAISGKCSLTFSANSVRIDGPGVRRVQFAASTVPIAELREALQAMEVAS